MSVESLARSTLLRPSITTWTRLEPLPRDASLARSLRAQVRDPLWMLARQWQVGEFAGTDGGSPVQASFTREQQPLTTYRPSSDPAQTVSLDEILPLEAHVERETVRLKLRGSVQLGQYFESLVRRGGVANPETVITAFRASFPVTPTPPDPTYASPQSIRFRTLMAGRVTDGESLFLSAAAAAAGQAPPIPLPSAASDAGMPAVLSRLVSYRQSLFTEPSADSAWQDQQLRYAFAVGSPAPTESVTLEAPEFPGGHLDWYSFNLGSSGSGGSGSGSEEAAATEVNFTFLPNHVAFRGMHDPRWWTFEDSLTDFGQLDAQHVDLAKLLVMEFALIYGNDWFSVPVPTPVGNLVRVTTLVVTDTFGVRTLIRPAAPPWSMFTISGGATRSDFLLMPPTVGVVTDADPIEAVVLLRDDMAAMAWAVEHKLQGDLDTAVDAQQASLARIQRDPPPASPVAKPDGPQVYYTTEIPSPENWIPMVPVVTAQGARLLRRGTMEIPTSSGLLPVVARAELLDPGHPFVVDDRTVPRSGLSAERYFRRARAMDGSTFLWLARSSGPGTGPGWSGLRFDAVQEMTAAS